MVKPRTWTRTWYMYIYTDKWRLESISAKKLPRSNDSTTRLQVFHGPFSVPHYDFDALRPDQRLYLSEGKRQSEALIKLVPRRLFLHFDLFDSLPSHMLPGRVSVPVWCPYIRQGCGLSCLPSTRYDILFFSSRCKHNKSIKERDLKTKTEVKKKNNKITLRYRRVLTRMNKGWLTLWMR